MYGRYSVDRYQGLESRVEYLEDELDALMKEFWDAEEELGEEEAEAMFGDDIADLERQIEDAQGSLGAIEYHWLEQDYYASVL